MTPEQARLRHLRLVGWGLALLSLAVVGISAWLRLAGAGLGCPDWPACYAGLLAGDKYVPPAGGRMLHRIVATSALLLAIYACWRSLKPTPLPQVARQAFRLLGLMLLLAVVGIWSSDPGRVWANFINLLGGLALVVLAWRVVLATGSSERGNGAGSAPLVGVGMGMLGATVLLGALIGARYAALDASAAGIALHWLHRLCAVAAFLLLGQAVLRQSGSSAGRAVMALLVIEVLLGVLLLLADFPLWVGVAHNVVAALLLAAVAQLGSAD